MNESSFYKYGFDQLNGAIDIKAAKKFNNYLKKKFKVSSKIFIDERTFLNHKKKNIKFNQKNILDLYNTDFVFKNKLFKKKIEEIIGKKFEIQSKKVICSLPKKFYPKWIDKYKAKDERSRTEQFNMRFYDNNNILSVTKSTKVRIDRLKRNIVNSNAPMMSVRVVILVCVSKVFSLLSFYLPL